VFEGANSRERCPDVVYTAGTHAEWSHRSQIESSPRWDQLKRLFPALPIPFNPPPGDLPVTLKLIEDLDRSQGTFQTSHGARVCDEVPRLHGCEDPAKSGAHVGEFRVESDQLAAVKKQTRIAAVVEALVGVPIAAVLDSKIAIPW
jgi:hypothetical protein